MIGHRSAVHGIDLDAQTRCAHYHSPLDIIAIRMKCCGLYYACIDCHAALADHPPAAWPQAEWDISTVLCGACGTEISIAQYLGCASQCPACKAPFNPRCANHHHLYFATPAAPPGNPAA